MLFPTQYLDACFPFGPCRLPRTKLEVGSDYRKWELVLGLDEGEDHESESESESESERGEEYGVENKDRKAPVEPNISNGTARI